MGLFDKKKEKEVVEVVKKEKEGLSNEELVFLRNLLLSKEEVKLANAVEQGKEMIMLTQKIDELIR